jgi:hypothetical protein
MLETGNKRAAMRLHISIIFNPKVEVCGVTNTNRVAKHSAESATCQAREGRVDLPNSLFFF